MCLMQTDLPVPDGPRIIEILPSGRPMFRPRRILLRPKALWTSMNSTASGTPVGRLMPVCQWYSSSAFGSGSLDDAAPAAAAARLRRAPVSAATSAAACALVRAVLGVEPLELLLGRHGPRSGCRACSSM